MSRRSQHRRRVLLKNPDKWAGYAAGAVADAQRTQVPLPMRKKVRA